MELQSHAAGALWAASLPFSWNALVVSISPENKVAAHHCIINSFCLKNISLRLSPPLYRLQKGTLMSVLHLKDCLNCERCSFKVFLLSLFVCCSSAIVPHRVCHFLSLFLDWNILYDILSQNWNCSLDTCLKGVYNLRLYFLLSLKQRMRTNSTACLTSLWHWLKFCEFPSLLYAFFWQRENKKLDEFILTIRRQQPQLGEVFTEHSRRVQ
jgi:hypothetical protein